MVQTPERRTVKIIKPSLESVKGILRPSAINHLNQDGVVSGSSSKRPVQVQKR
jgi:hypothetical protein